MVASWRVNRTRSVSLTDQTRLARTAGGGFFLQGEHHEPAAHEAGYGIVFIEGILNAGDDPAGGVASLVGEGDHIIVVIMHIAATVP